MIGNKKIIVVLPAYNSEKTLEKKCTIVDIAGGPRFKFCCIRVFRCFAWSGSTSNGSSEDLEMSAMLQPQEFLVGKNKFCPGDK